MDELELRVAALELLLMERLALDPPDLLHRLGQLVKSEDELLADRVDALSGILGARLALDRPGLRFAVADGIRSGLATDPAGDERIIRLQAFSVIDDAVRRFDEFSGGLALPHAPREP